MVEFSREELKAVIDKRIALQDSDNWDGYANTFTEDAVYVEHPEGTFEGKEAIRKWLVPIMALCKGWTSPIYEAPYILHASSLRRLVFNRGKISRR